MIFPFCLFSCHLYEFYLLILIFYLSCPFYLYLYPCLFCPSLLEICFFFDIAWNRPHSIISASFIYTRDAKCTSLQIIIFGMILIRAWHAYSYSIHLFYNFRQCAVCI